MMASMETYLQKGRIQLRRLAVEPRVRAGAAVAGYALAGFLLSAAALSNAAMPIAMGLISAMTGWRTLVMALGSIAGCWVFWGEAGYQAMVWAALGCMTGLFLGKKRMAEQMPLLIPSLSGLLVASTGLAFQLLWHDDTKVSVYLLRVGLAMGASGLFGVVVRRREPIADWIAEGAAVLALAQVIPFPAANLGILAGGALAAWGAFPAAALAGLALDLARVSPTPMTAVLCLSFFLRMIPKMSWQLRGLGTGFTYLLVMGLCGVWDPVPVIGLFVGGTLGMFLPHRGEVAHRKGETGTAQVRLEWMAQVLSETQQLLLEGEEEPPDEEAVLQLCRERACGGCPNRKQCRDVEIPRQLLHAQLTDTSMLGFPCKKPGRMILELRRSQEHLRSLRAQRDRRRECREAVIQQYQFLGEYLREQADSLPRRAKKLRPRYTPEVAVCSSGKEHANGDRCLWFMGTECRYYILLCDGMGTGLGAAQEAKTAAELLRQMLCAGFPAEYAVRSLNSLLILRGRSGAVTVDLAQIQLTTGAVTLFKWGAAPSWVLRETGAEKIGTAGPPPGLSMTDARETVERLSLRRGEVLMMVSDGVDGEGVLRRGEEWSPQLPPGELAARVLERGSGDGSDDATAAVIRLAPITLST